jgi:hypothetical protein
MTENKKDMTATEARPAPAGADAPAAPARNPEQTSPGKTLDAILADAASRPAEFVESWEVPGGAE